jgi:hypothetical protein
VEKLTPAEAHPLVELIKLLAKIDARVNAKAEGTARRPS